MSIFTSWLPVCHLSQHLVQNPQPYKNYLISFLDYVRSNSYSESLILHNCYGFASLIKLWQIWGPFVKVNMIYLFYFFPNTQILPIVNTRCRALCHTLKGSRWIRQSIPALGSTVWSTYIFLSYVKEPVALLNTKNVIIQLLEHIWVC